TPSSTTKPISTARPGSIGMVSPPQKCVISPSLGSSGRRGWLAGGGTGSKRMNHSAALDNSPDMVDSEVIKELPIIRHVEEDQVGLLAHLKRTEPVGPAQRRRGIEREGSHHLGRQHAHLRTRHAADQRQILGRTCARVAIAGQGHGQAALDQLARRSVIQSQKECSSWKQRRHRARLSQSLDASIADTEQVIGGGSAKARRQLSAAKRTHFIGVQLELKAKLTSALEDAFHFLKTESADVAKDIAELGQPSACHLRQHLVEQQAYITFAIRAKFRRHGMSAEERRYQLNRSFGIEFGD